MTERTIPTPRQNIHQNYRYPTNSTVDHSRHGRRFSLQHYLAGGICLLSVGLLFEQFDVRLPRQIMAIAGPIKPAGAERCDKVIQSKTRLSRQALGKVLTVPEGKSRAQIRAIAKQPYCTLPPLTVRVGETTEREAYPLAFEPDTWLVVIYEGNNYAGFDFLVQ
ncbi:hypothetical protein IQ266_15140 [filamentous cyanobacterium LEGE 11480]|uniref:Uncharacterized protein n=1 Tax=Romeriopsis navalis LEGE 11480 TaxID=2777977 RepID=A0A928Z542_9CYAN|nr:hypothetical protein [Romeriopsis navalis]MBE9031068.1 hypothetical protein [Romeriopsis navalis LEGE 11480]